MKARKTHFLMENTTTKVMAVRVSLRAGNLGLFDALFFFANIIGLLFFLLLFFLFFLSFLFAFLFAFLFLLFLNWWRLHKFYFYLFLNVLRLENWLWFLVENIDKTSVKFVLYKNANEMRKKRNCGA
jgi:hypothetical protein